MKRIQLPSNISGLARAILTITRKNKLAKEPVSFEKIFHAVPIDRKRLEKYNQLFGKSYSTIPLTVLYFMSQRAQITSMLDKRVNFVVPGLVHTHNELCIINEPNLLLPWRVDCKLNISKTGEHDIIQITLNNQLSQKNNTIASCKSVYRVLNKSRSSKNKKNSHPIIKFNKQQLDTWKLTSNMGRLYAGISGDYNPIHLYKSTAKIFGFKQPIIHGMYSHSRISAFLENKFEKPIKTISIAFKKPIYLPSEVQLEIENDSLEQGKFQIVDKELAILHLEGEYTFKE